MEAASALGLDVDQLLARSGLARAALEDIDGRIDGASLLLLWELVAEQAGDPFFGLHAGERFVSAKTIHIVGYAARNCLTLGDCYERTERFGRLTNEASEIALRVEGDRAIMRVGPLPGFPIWPRCYAEMALTAYITLGQKWTGVALGTIGATFQHAAPADVSEYTRIFGAQVRFGAPKNELILPAPTLELPLREPDPSLREYLDLRAAVMLASVKEGHDFENVVRSKMDEVLANGTPTLGAVARRLGMSGRTLQRRLTEEGLSFSDVVDDVRKTAALGLIENPRFSVFEVAALAGYRDAQSFRAAFVRWTGVTPRDYRRARSGVGTCTRQSP
jgi:AraC-like DNA-binding protein